MSSYSWERETFDFTPRRPCNQTQLNKHKKNWRPRNKEGFDFKDCRVFRTWFFSCMVSSRNNGLVSTWTQLSSFLWLLFCFTFICIYIFFEAVKKSEKARGRRLFLVTGLRIIYCINFFPGHFSFTGVGKVFVRWRVCESKVRFVTKVFAWKGNCWENFEAF